MEVVAINQLWNSEQSHVPAHYKNPWFWACRLLLACIGGGLTIAYGIKENPILAVNVGAAAPLIVRALASGVSGKLKLP